MTEIVKLNAGDEVPEAGDFLVITCSGRPRAFEYFIDASPSLETRVGDRLQSDKPGYASLKTALGMAEQMASQHDVPTIFVQESAVTARPFFTPVV